MNLQTLVLASLIVVLLGDKIVTAAVYYNVFLLPKSCYVKSMLIDENTLSVSAEKSMPHRNYAQ
jgi:hypothetical protein